MFISESEKLIVDWDYNKNAEIGLFPDSVSIGSHKRVHWKCHICGGEWNTVVKERRGCPYCTGFKVLEGFNDLATTHPLIAAEWAPDNKLKPTQVTAGSNKVVSWICERGHIWRTSICARVKGDSCSYCSGKKVMAGFNDLASLFPEIAREWDVEKNGSVRPEEVTAGSNLIVWWKCSLGHEWSTRISQRTKGTGCPVCSNKTVLVGFNDVASQFPAICAEWDYEKNSTTPQSYTSGSNYKAWWKCERGHSWKAPIVDRCRGYGCPKCSEERHVSFPEKAVLFYIRKIFPEAVANYRDKWCSPYELDIYIPNIAVAIEYDGIYGHSGIKGIERDIRKNDKCASHEVALIRIRENGCPLTNSSSFDYIMDRDNNIAPAIAFIIRTIGEITGRKYDIPEVDIVHDSGEIYSLIEFTEKQNSLALAYPDIAKMWNTSKNGTLSPEMVSSGSQKKYGGEESVDMNGKGRYIIRFAASIVHIA